MVYFIRISLDDDLVHSTVNTTQSEHFLLSNDCAYHCYDDLLLLAIALVRLKEGLVALCTRS